MKKLTLSVVLTLGLGSAVFAQGDLSNQVLRLLSRINTWSALQSYTAGTGVILLGRQSVPLGTRTDRLENIGGNLYFNGTVLASAVSAGTVTSVGISAPSAVFDIANSPVTSSGTIAITFDTQSANTVFAGPLSGGAATPTFRALTDADIPNAPTIDCTDCVTWASVSKSGSSLADLATRSASALSSGTLPDARFPSTLPALNGSNLTALNATQLTSGTLPAARMPALTGDITSSSGAVATTLTDTSVVADTYGDATHTVTLAVDSKGRLTGVSENLIAAVGSSVPETFQGDILYASASNVLSALTKSATATRYLSNTGASNNPQWAAVDLSNGTTGTLINANGGTGLDTSAAANGRLLIGNGTGFTLAAVTGTANQVVVTNGAGSITLSTPQSIGTASTPQFARLGLGTGAGGTAVLTTTGTFDTGYYNAGNSGAALTLNLLNGMTQKLVLTANCTFTINNPVSGTVYTLVLVQDGTGSRIATWPGTVVWQGGSAPTLTTGANKADIITLVYNGATYYGRSSLNY